MNLSRRANSSRPSLPLLSSSKLPTSARTSERGMSRMPSMRSASKISRELRKKEQKKEHSSRTCGRNGVATYGEKRVVGDSFCVFS